MNETQTKDRHLRWPVIVCLVLALLLVVFFTGDFNIYGVICIAHHFEATPNEALIRYGMAPLFVHFPRDLVIHVAMENRIFEIHEVDALLREHGLAPLLP